MKQNAVLICLYIRKYFLDERSYYIMRTKKIVSFITAAFLTLMPAARVMAEDEQSFFSSSYDEVYSESNVIAGYIFGDYPYESMSFGEKDRPSLKKLTARMPSSLEAKLDNGDIVNVPVEWVCDTDDYENSADHYYTFVPKVRGGFVLSEDISDMEDIPYIAVFVSDKAVSSSVDEELSSVTGSSNEAQVYSFLVNTLRCNNAMAMGIMANIYSESSFNPTANVIDTNGLLSYGLCQWNGERFNALQNFCLSNGYQYNTVYGQLMYLKYELETSESAAWNAIRSIENNSAGAYTAGYLWAQKFERCTQYYNGTDQFAKRGQLARDTFWPMYQTLTDPREVVISGNNSPKTIICGKTFSISGIVRTGSPITKITVGCYDAKGAKGTEFVSTPNATSFNLKDADPYILFNKLSAGVYKYTVTVQTAYGTTKIVDDTFIVLSNVQTGADGTYVFRCLSNGQLAPAADSSNNVVLKKYDRNSAAQMWKVTYVSDGYFTVMNAASGLYLDLKGSDAVTAQRSSADSQLWQILPVCGNISLVPKSNTFSCLNIYRGTFTENTKLNINTPYLDGGQVFTVEQISSVPVYGANKITFNTNGGSFPSDSMAYTADGMNRGRAAGELIVYTSLSPVPTGTKGIEAAVNSDGMVISVRTAGSSIQLTIPENGFVVSGSNEGNGYAANFVNRIQAGYYVSFDSSTRKVTAYPSADTYLANNKYVYTGKKYGRLPVPTRAGYAFDGWYTSASGGTKITEDSVYSVSTLYAHWSQPTEITAHPVMTSAIEGLEADFTVTAKGTDVKYQWQEYTDSWKDMDGMTSAKLTLAHVSADMNGRLYRCVVTASGKASAASYAGMLNVTPCEKASVDEVKALTAAQCADFVNAFSAKASTDPFVLTAAEYEAVKRVLG